jgi:hypothetical protein
MTSRRLLLSAFSWAALATTGVVQGAAPKAVIEGTSRIPSGGTIALTAADSVSDKPLVWKVKGPKLVYTIGDSQGRQGVFLLAFNVPSGTYRFIVEARAKPEGAADYDSDVDVLDVVVGDQPVPPTPGPTPGPTPPTPGPTPNPTPTPGPTPPPGPAPGPPNPGPIPGFDAQANGRTWAKELIDTFADSLTQAGRDIMDGKSMDQAKKDHVARWAKTRDDAFNARFVGALDQLVPSNVTNPSIEQRRRYGEFIQSLTQGAKEAVH